LIPSIDLKFSSGFGAPLSHERREGEGASEGGEGAEGERERQWMGARYRERASKRKREREASKEEERGGEREKERMRER